METKDSVKQNVPPMKKMMRLQVIIRNADKSGRKNTTDALFSTFKDGGLSGATAWLGVKGYGSRGQSTSSIIEMSWKLPLIIEAVDTHEKVEPLLGKVKEIVGDRGLITLEEVSVL